MKIKAITIENFKSISEPVRIEFKPLTLLFGPNSAGKSTIIQALHYIREVLEFRRLDVDKTISGGDFIDLGGFDNFVHGHDTSRMVSFKIELHAAESNDEWDTVSVDKEDEIFPIIEASGEKWLSFSVTKAGGNVCIDSFIISYNNRIVIEGRRLSDSVELSRYIVPLKFDINELLRTTSGRSFAREQFCKKNYKRDLADNILPEYGAVSPYKEYDSELDTEGRAFDYAERSVVDTIVNELQALRYVGPLRTIPPRNYSPQKTFAPSRWADGLAAWDRASYPDNTEAPVDIDEVNKWLGKECLSTGYEFKRQGVITLEQDVLQEMESAVNLSKQKLVDLVSRLYAKKLPKVALTQSKDGLEVSLCDVGVGISQTFPVVMAALDKKAKMVIIEQPELHIHPRLQVSLGDLFISATQGKCMIIETHSEHLVLRLMRRMRETFNKNLPDDLPGVTPEDISILYVQPSEKGPLLRALELDAEGQLLDPWPGGFFEEGYHERFA